MASPIPGVLICMAYVPLVVWILPKYMEKRPAYDLRTFMTIYNFAMVVLSGYIFVEV